MKKIVNLHRTLSRAFPLRWLLIAISTLLPIVITLIFGIVLAVKHDYLLDLSVAIAAGTLIFTFPIFLMNWFSKKRLATLAEEAEFEQNLKDDFVKANIDWSDAELNIWSKTKKHNRRLIEKEMAWTDLDTAGLGVLEFVASNFEKKALDFSIPECLLLFSEACRRYNLVVKDNIPGIEFLKVSHIKSGYDIYDKYGEAGQNILKALILFRNAKNLYDNPAKLIFDTVDNQANSTMTQGIIDEMQGKAKVALLDEIGAVAIDLYSGRFTLELNEIKESEISKADEKRFIPELEPIRIVLVGQTGAGKSSIVNILRDEFVAEVDVLPSTDQTGVYVAKVDEFDVRVVDLKGLDGTEESETVSFNEITQADIVLWALKANQSARQLDISLFKKFNEYFESKENISRKKPKILSIINHVDRLNPVSEWEPPYDMSTPLSGKAKIISEAVAYNQKLFNSDIAIALSVSQNKCHFGVEELKRVLKEKFDEAKNIQRNRQRLDTQENSFSIKKQAKRIYNLSKNLAPSVINSAIDNHKINPNKEGIS